MNKEIYILYSNWRKKYLSKIANHNRRYWTSKKEKAYKFTDINNATWFARAFICELQKVEE